MLGWALVVAMAGPAEVLQPDAMSEALGRIQQTLQDVHPAPFAVVDARAQARALKRARKDVRSPMEAAAFAGVAARLVAQMHDAHTSLRYSGADRYLAVRFAWAHDGLGIVEGPATGAVARLGGMDVASLQAALAEFVPAENEHWVRARGAGLLTARSTWVALGTPGDVVTAELADGTTLELAFERSARWVAPESEPAVWWTTVPEAHLGWLRLASCPTPTQEHRDAIADLFHELHAQDLDTLVIDVRGNGGGNSSILNPVLEYLPQDELAAYGGRRRITEAARAQRSGLEGLPVDADGYFEARDTWRKSRRHARLTPYAGDVLVLTDAGTFSSGNWVAVMLHDNQLATIVGEPTGNAPSSFGDLLTFPGVAGQDELTLNVSYTQWVRPDPTQDPATTLQPDELVRTDLADVLAGRDPVWAWLQERQGAKDLPEPVPPPDERPTVASLSPANGAADVDPGTTELTVQFSEPMRANSMSLVGGGDTFPEVVEGPDAFAWTSPTTLVVRVRLQPGKTYQLGVNSERYQGFVSEDGVPARPVSWTFTTAEAR